MPTRPEPDGEYYALTLYAENGRPFLAMQTLWVGFAQEKPLKELRQARVVYGRFGELWDRIRQPYLVVHEREDVFRLLLAGGHALIEKSLFEEELPEFMEPLVCVPDGLRGFAGVNVFDSAAFRRAPTPKLRMGVLNRDGRRCRICGRRPDDDVDLQLHVHHIRQWALGGVTLAGNLITLCHTCHDGLQPHQDLSLYDYIDPGTEKPEVEKALAAHLEKVEDYRRVIVSYLQGKESAA